MADPQIEDPDSKHIEALLPKAMAPEDKMLATVMVAAMLPVQKQQQKANEASARLRSHEYTTGGSTERGYISADAAKQRDTLEDMQRVSDNMGKICLENGKGAVFEEARKTSERISEQGTTKAASQLCPINR